MQTGPLRDQQTVVAERVLAALADGTEPDRHDVDRLVAAGHLACPKTTRAVRDAPAEFERMRVIDLAARLLTTAAGDGQGEPKSKVIKVF